MKLFAFGSNGSGQLGIGHEEDVSSPVQCHFTPAPNDSIAKIAAGGNHTLILTKLGHVYAAGCNEDNRCGPTQPSSSSDSPETNTNSNNITSFKQVILTDQITGSTVDTFTHIAATWEGSILVSSYTGPPSQTETQDRVFVLGSSPRSELGLALASGTAILPGKSLPAFPPNGKILALASGMAHAVVVLSSGEVYGWGGARKGQLGEGLKGEKIVGVPKRIEGIPFFVTGAVCGREFTVVFGRKEEGEILVLGDKGNRWGVLDVREKEGLGLRVRERERLCSGSSGSGGWGLGQETGLGLEQGRMGASVGSDSSSAFRWGVRDIGASWHGIYVLGFSGANLKTVGSDSGSTADASGLEERFLVAWGRNDRGQLPPADLPALQALAVGSEHVLVLLRDGSVAAFGWGEHGNCGPETDPHGNVAGLYKVIPVDVRDGERVVGVGAGCATSWVIVE